MKFFMNNHSFRYELEKLLRLFFPFEKLTYYEDEKFENCCGFDTPDDFVITEVADGYALARVCIAGNTACEKTKILSNDGKEIELKLALSLYRCLTSVTDYYPEWGMLTGVRPAKLMSRLCEEMGKDSAEDYLMNTLMVSEKKLSLCRETVKTEEAIIKLSQKNSFSLYISIPFCPTRCAYCSFVSHSVESAGKLIPSYVEKLCEEIRLTGKKAKANNLLLETIYIGGGTPTAVSAEMLEKIMQTIEESFCTSSVREYTVEAGRPDTVTKEKLEVIKRYGATRISINPQTMNDSVLEKIGRKHTSLQTVEAYNLARDVGFRNINMDLIAGLPGDSPESFKNTVFKVLELKPESVTVHSLSMKRSATMSKNGELPEISVGKAASEMVDFAHGILSENGILPYYMYRQSKTVGNLENVGYAKPGNEGLYNVYIMDETHTILACGASAVTKLREPGGNYIERIFNFKYPYEYIDRFDELMDRKAAIDKFYKQYGI